MTHNLVESWLGGGTAGNTVLAIVDYGKAMTGDPTVIIDTIHGM